MTRRDDMLRLRHMLDHSREAVELTQDETHESLNDNRVLQLALVRLVEIIGEAAARVSQEICEGHPEIPWPQIVGIRNRLVHGYDSVDLQILWDTITDDLPPLIADLEAIVGASK